MASISNSVIYFGAPPDLKAYCCIEVCVKQQKRSNNSSNTILQSYIIRCREILFTEPNVIGCPSTRDRQSIFLVMHINYHKTGQLVGRLQKLGMRVLDPEDVSLARYQSCLKYTLAAKMCPSWNTVGDYLLQGREFLIQGSKKPAISFDLQVNHKETIYSLRPAAMTLPPISIGDLDISLDKLVKFSQESDGYIDQSSIGNKWCHILPSMKKGQIVRISHKMPVTPGGFSTYKELRRYWKNTYGYRLPETDENIFYCQVNFKLVGSTLFTYPHLCVRRQGVFVGTSREDADVCENFVDDMKKQLKNVCGEKLKLSTSRWALQMELQQASQLKIPGKHAPANVTLIPKTSGMKIVHQTIQTPVSNSSYMYKPSGVTSVNTGTPLNISTASSSAGLCSAIRSELIISEPAVMSSTPVVPPFMKAAIKRKILTNSSNTPGVKRLCMSNKLQSISTTTAAGRQSCSVGSLNSSGYHSQISGETSQIGVSVLKEPIIDIISKKTTPGNHVPNAIRSPLSVIKTPSNQIQTQPNQKGHGAFQLQMHNPPVLQPFEKAVDIAALVAKNQLHTVKVAALRQWLKVKGISCKAKDKKADLTEKVLKAIAET